jgi:tetratricopeptide (TPR) repeat protein
MLPADAARAIAARLNSAAAQPSPGRFVSPEAHDAYLRGHYLWAVGRNEEAGREFQEAVKLQPDYALGWTGVSQYYGTGAFYGKLDPSALPSCKAAAEKALLLDPTLPEAHLAFAAAAFFVDWDGPHALEEISRATELEPGSAEAIHMHALFLSAMGRDEEAIAVQKTSPNFFGHPAVMAEILFFARQYDEALADARMRLQDFPRSPSLLRYLGGIYHAKGMDREAALAVAKLYSGPHGEPNQAVLEAFQSGGYRRVLEWQVAELQRSEYVSPARLAALEAQLGQQEKAFASLAEALRIHDPALVLLGADPAYDGIHNDPRFRDLVAQIGLRTPFLVEAARP